MPPPSTQIETDSTALDQVSHHYRAGRHQNQLTNHLTGYRAFIPTSLPLTDEMETEIGQ